MNKDTLIMFNLLLAIFAVYSLIENNIDYFLFVPLFCLVAMFFVGKYAGEKN